MKMVKNRLNRILFFFILMVVFSGCAKLAHLQQLLTLKAYSQNKELQAEYVEEHDRQFRELLKVVRDNSLDQYPDKESFLEQFGDPVFVREVMRNGRLHNLWLYRYAAQFSGSEKVYLYFDEKGILQGWEHVAAQKQEDEG